MNAVHSARFQASRAATCESVYVCEGIEVGDRAAYVNEPTAPRTVLMCAACADRTEAATELGDLIAPPRTANPLPGAPATLAEAVEELRTAFETTGTYPTELVDAALALMDVGADEVAAFERDRWVRWFRHVAANGRNLGEPLRAGSRWAAEQLARNLARPTREGIPTA